MKKLFIISLFLIFVFGFKNGNAEQQIRTITWIGHPVISDNDDYFPSEGWLPNYQIGFRDDGVVVWKKMKEEK